jgi:hypothetical protein
MVGNTQVANAQVGMAQVGMAQVGYDTLQPASTLSTWPVT